MNKHCKRLGPTSAKYLNFSFGFNSAILNNLLLIISFYQLNEDGILLIYFLF